MKKYVGILLFLFCSVFSFSAKVKSYGVSQQELIQMSYEVAEKVFEDNHEMWKHLLVGTLAVETNLGQFKGNSIYGVAQMRNSGFQFVQKELKKRGEEKEVFESLAGKELNQIQLSMLEKEHRLAILYMAYYYKFLVHNQVEFNTKEGAAKIWKKYYNTYLGKGSPESFLKAYSKQAVYLKDFEKEETEEALPELEEEVVEEEEQE